jgi:hypothetical protein
MELINTFESSFTIQKIAYDYHGKRMAVSDSIGLIRIYQLEQEF